MTTPGAVRVSLFGQTTAGLPGLTADQTSYTLGVQITVALPVPLAGMWFRSPPGGALPAIIALYQANSASSGTLLANQTAAAGGGWSGAAGSGWVFARFTSPPQLVPGVAYKACVATAAGHWANWYGSTANYFSSGPGSAGIARPPLAAPNNAGSFGGQMTFAQQSGTAPLYPNQSFNASNYWIDPEVEVPSGVRLPRGWDGAAWREGRLRGWDGSQWRGARVWDGQQWRSMTG